MLDYIKTLEQIVSDNTTTVLSNRGNAIIIRINATRRTELWRCVFMNGSNKGFYVRTRYRS